MGRATFMCLGVGLSAAFASGWSPVFPMSSPSTLTATRTGAWTSQAGAAALKRCRRRVECASRSRGGGTWTRLRSVTERVGGAGVAIGTSSDGSAAGEIDLDRLEIPAVPATVAGSTADDEDDHESGDENVDVNELRLRLLRQSGLDVEEEGDPLEALGDSGPGEDPQVALDDLADRLRGAFATNLLKDLDISRLVDTELEKGGLELEKLAEDMKAGQANVTDALAEEFGRAFQRETDMMMDEYEGKARRMLGVMEREKANLAREMEVMSSLQREIDRDPILQFRSFPSKGPLRQSALVVAILLANRAVYQALLLAQGRAGGDPVTAAAEFAATAALCYFYGFRLF